MILYYICKNVEIAKVILTVAYNNYRVYNKEDSLEDLLGSSIWTTTGIFFIREDGILNGYGIEKTFLEYHKNASKVPLENFLLSLYSEKIVKIQLNKTYTATFRKGDKEVTVDCQKIPITAIKELYEAVYNK